MHKPIIHDVIVIGSGAAGLMFSLEASKTLDLVIITKSTLQESNTKYAQGGIAAVLKIEDDYQSHFEDTLVAGDGMGDIEAIKILVQEAPARIRDLWTLGVEFDKNQDAQPDFTLEGGHRSNRILHVGDLTGKVIEERLVKNVKTKKKIKVISHAMVIDLIVQDGICYGVTYLTQDKQVKQLFSRAVVLSTGGAGQLYAINTNPKIATGDGIAMAFRVGANVENMEFVQFHPTAFYKPPAPYFLISESVRGEGGKLYNTNAERFMGKYNALQELAPRDVVSRAIYNEMKKCGSSNVYLDISHKNVSFVKNRFPFIYKKCKELGVDITNEPIPVAPAAHYMCGGVETDIDGRTSILGLYAIGEVACTGVHGANRLASNSLLESIVFAYRAAINADRYVRILSQTRYKTRLTKNQFCNYPTRIPTANIIREIQKKRQELQETMWQCAGIVRTDKLLEKGLKIVKKIEKETESIFRDLHPAQEICELRNLANIARIILHSAKQRRVNAGAHYNIDLE